MTDDALLDALRRAVAAAPDDVRLRLHLAETLVAQSSWNEALAEAAAVLARDPDSSEARRIATVAMSSNDPASPLPAPSAPAFPASLTPIAPSPAHESSSPAQADLFDWNAAEQEVAGVASPMFVADPSQPRDLPGLDRPTITLADVGGMTQAKARLDAAFFAPLRNEELRRLYGKSLRGGLLLYGPPGCGKTHLARAVAGELGAHFLTVGLSEVLDPYFGVSEQNVHELFQLARREAPCVLFLDEVDAIGQRRALARGGGMRGVVVQLLQELDGVDGENEGVFILAATNQPWDLDPALRRPGRLDRTILVLPPDLEAREAIFRMHLRDRPIEGIDAGRLALDSDGLTGADIAYVCELAAERALLDSVASGTARQIGMEDLVHGLSQVSPSANTWLDSARNVVMFGDDDGTFAELKAYLKQRRRL